MKKSLITLLVLNLLFGAFLMSCSSDVDSPAAYSTELVDVTFDEGSNSKSLTATLEGFNKGEYYWKYAAKKADNSGLTSGATATYDEAGAQPVSNGHQGLGSGSGSAYSPYKVSGFSQGLWDFTLYAYRNMNTSGAYENLIYTGEVKNVSLTKGGSNSVQVLVSPISTGNGFIKISTITFVPKKLGDSDSHTKVIEVTNPDGSAVSGISYDSTKEEYSVPAGAYKVTVKFTNSAGTIVYGEGYVIATVYPSLITTVAGSLNELVTYAQFDADLNPDAVNAQAVNDNITYDAGEQAQDVALASTSSKKTVTTTVKRADVNNIITQMAAEQAVPTDSSKTSLKLALNVDPTEATQTTVTYEIGMTATLTYKETSESAAQVSEKPVINLDNYIVVEIQMSTGLSEVNVTHSGLNMKKCTSKTDLDAKTGTDDTNKAGYFYYDPAGTLYLKTIKFSPFAISYTAPTNYVASVDGVKYGTLAEAIAKVKSSSDQGYPSTVKLLADVALTSTQETTESFTLDLNGFSIAAENCRAIHVKEGTLTLKGTGTIAANKVGSSDFSASSSVIRVGDGFKENEDGGTAAGLIVGENVTISSSYCYGVTLFGRETEGQTLIVNGKIKVTGTASAISGNGTGSLSATSITINYGAEVFAENDYAIYHPQKGTLTVEGGTIEGKGGIEAKGGNVIVNGGAITATAPKQSHEEYNNGASTSGYALAAVKNPNYPGEGSIRVNDGMITGELILATDEEASFTTKLEAAGGTFTVDPTDYLADGCSKIYNADGTWTVVRTKVAKIGDTYYETLKDALMYVQSGQTVTLLCDLDLTEKAGSGYSNYYRYVLYKGRTLDGDGHTITLRIDADDQALFEELYGTIKNLTIDFGTVKKGCIAAQSESGARFENVVVKGTFTKLSGNCGAFVRYVWGDISLVDCISYVNMTGTGTDGDYDAVFLGYTNVSKGVTLTFTRCVNYGTVSCGHVALFVGNTTYDPDTFVIEECYNNGELYGLQGHVGNNPYPNIICAVTGDGSLSFCKFSINGENYSYNQVTNGAADSVINKGVYVVGSKTTTLSISENADGTFVVTPTEGASYYTVGVGLYTTLKAGGTTRNFVYETIQIAGDSAKTNVKNLSFVDDQWVAANEGAVATDVQYGDNSYTVYTLGGSSYYLINNTTKDTLHGDVRPATLISVSAFDANGKLIAVASLSTN